MCGIFACVADAGDTVDVVASGLRLLEYRGYDSAGIGVTAAPGSPLSRIRVHGGVDTLMREYATSPLRGPLAVGHTRWATHGAPSSANAHPHLDCSGRVGIVHNGIVENFAEVRNSLADAGHRLVSQTDTELLAHLVEAQLPDDDRDPLDALVEAVRQALTSAEGAQACVVFSADHPDALVCVRRGSAGGLRVALGEGRAYVASDGAALAAVAGAESACVIPPDTIAVVRPHTVSLHGLFDAVRVAIRWAPLPRMAGPAPMPADDRSGSAFFREAMEQPAAFARQARTVREILRGRPAADAGRGGDLLEVAFRERRIRTVRLLACGTPMYACLIARDYIQSITGLPAIVEHAHEFAHSRHAMACRTDLAVVVSQSGETVDSLLALQKAKAAGALCVAVTNTVDSTIDQAAGASFYTDCGPEYSVAQTKAFTGAIITLLGIACLLGQYRGTLTADIRAQVGRAADQVPDLAVQALQLSDIHLPPVVAALKSERSCFFLGRGLNYPVAMEGALKLKELSYLHAEGYPAGELKHGPIALIEPGFPVVAIVGRDESRPKMLSQLAEVTARGARVIAVAEEDDDQARAASSMIIPVPIGATNGLLAPVVNIIPLQLLAGLVAQARGCNVDRPRNLAKSVTVI
jgi:glucosamine--fructose-6-phosphate aminotransferase (isomerizing)